MEGDLLQSGLICRVMALDGAVPTTYSTSFLSHNVCDSKVAPGAAVGSRTSESLQGAPGVRRKFREEM